MSRLGYALSVSALLTVFCAAVWLTGLAPFFTPLHAALYAAAAVGWNALSLDRAKALRMSWTHLTPFVSGLGLYIAMGLIGAYHDVPHRPVLMVLGFYTALGGFLSWPLASAILSILPRRSLH